MGSIGGGGNNSDFQSELLRMNGSLQSSITELRYHCEVYRLSLRSICKVLVSVQKEQDTRLRYLTTSRPSFHAYLLSLSQKQALDRIRNVVRKASTFINGYSLVDKNLFQPPPPKPSTVRRTVSCDESKKTIPAPNNSKPLDSLGRGSEGYSDGGDIGAVGILAVIAEEDEEEASVNKKQNDDTETASSKKNNGKVQRKHHSKNRLRRGGKERKKKTSGSSSKKSKSRSTKSKRSYGHSSAGSEDGEIKKHGSNSDESNDDGDNKPSRKETKRRERKSKKVISRSNSYSNRSDAAAILGHTDSINIKKNVTELKKSPKETRSRSRSITPTSRDNYRHRFHRHQVINSRRLSNQYEEGQLDDENVNKDASFPSNAELNRRYHKQQSTLLSQSKSITNRIPSLFSISTSTSTVSSVVVGMRRNKTSATSFLVSEKFRADARRGGGGLGMRRPSSEKQLGRRVGSNSNMKNAKCAVEKDCRSQNHSNRNISSAICMKDRYECKTTRAAATARRWGNGTSTLTRFKAGYKVRESLAVVRNRNNDGNITAHQGQGGVGTARRYLFSSQRPRNNFKLSSFCSSAIVTDKVRRTQINGNCGGNNFCDGINEDKVYGANRKSVSSGGSGSINTNIGGSGINNKA